METTRISVGSLNEHLGETVFVEGLVYDIKDHGGILIIDIYDDSGYVKAVVGPDNPYCFGMAQKVKKGMHVGIKGKAKNAPHSVVGNESERIEIDVEKIIIFGKKGKKLI